MKRLFLFLFCCSLLIWNGLTLSSCSFFDSGKSNSNEPGLSGGGIRTTNGEVLGRVKYADASPAEGRQIHLYKILLSAKPGSFQAEWAGISDSIGRYLFSKVPAGKFVMTVTDIKAGEMAIVPRITKGKEGLFVLDALLSPWVSLVGRVLPPADVNPASITICIPGIPKCVVPGSDSVYVFSQAPQGDYDLVFLQDSVSHYLPIHVTKGGSDTLYVKDVKIDLSLLNNSNMSTSFSFYPADTKYSLYVTPVPYRRNNLPVWYSEKKFEGIRYFIATENKQFEQDDIEDYLDWSHSNSIRMPIYSPPDSSTRPLLDFPYLLRLDKSNFDFIQSKGQGQDFRIGRHNGRHLPYFIERWDSTAGIAEIWTRIDTLLVRSSGQTLTYYWGNSNAMDRSFTDAVLSRIPNERMVWMFDDNSTSSLVADIAGNFPGYFTKMGMGKGSTANNRVQGLIVNGFALNGVNDAITIDPHPLLDFPSFTVSIWAKNESPKLTTRQSILFKGEGESAHREWYLALDENQRLRFGIGGKTGQWAGTKITLKPIPNPDLWHQYTITFNAGKLLIYVDGVEFLTQKTGDIPASIPDFGSGIILGVPSSPEGSYWKGYVDHFYYDRQARSAEWIRLVYENQKR